MADNVTLNQNVTSGAVVATDDVSGAQYQRVKLDIGADGAASGTAGTASTPLRVDPTGSTTQPVSAASLPLPSGASTSAKQDTIIGHVDGIEGLLTTVAGTVAGTELQVDVLTMPTVTVTDGSGSLTVDGTVAATQSGTWTVQPGNTANTTAWKVDASSVAVPVTDNSGSLTIDNAALSVTGGGVEASALRVTLATDSTGVLSVDDNGSSLTVDGTVAATQSGTWNIATVTTVTGVTNVVHVDDNASSLSIDDGGNVISVDDGSGSLTVDAPVGTPVFVRLSDGASAITTLPVSVATVPSHAVTNAGTFAVQVDGSALTSLQLLDDVVSTTGSAITTKGYAVSGTDGTNARVLKTDTSGELQVDVLSVTLPTGGTPTSGTTSITTTASIQVHSNTACKMAILQNDPDNTNDMLIGTSGAESIQLVPGQSLSLPVSNLNLLYAKNTSSSTQTLNWISLT